MIETKYSKMILAAPVVLTTVRDVIKLLEALDGAGIIFVEEDEIVEFFGFEVSGED